MPTIRSRLWASGVAFALGFALANVGILRIVGPDRWVWLGAAVVLMLTGAVGVLVADTQRRLSWWSVVGLELLAIFLVVPLLWTVSVATSPESLPRDLVPSQLSFDAFDRVLSDPAYRRATTTSVLLALLTSIVSVALAAPAAYALVRRRPRGSRWVYVGTLAVLLGPVLALAVPWGEQLRAFGWAEDRWATAIPLLLVALPLALWFCVTVLRTAPWDLHDAVRADGATRGQQLRTFAVPALAPGLLLTTLLVFVVTSQDVVVGAALTASEESRPLPATLLLGSASPAVVAAAGLLWLLPALVVVAVMPRRTSQLVGRTTR
ncbi:MAG: ABC transporter permease subunit [Aeromicrobium erythreum]